MILLGALKVQATFIPCCHTIKSYLPKRNWFLDFLENRIWTRKLTNGLSQLRYSFNIFSSEYWIVVISNKLYGELYKCTYFLSMDTFQDCRQKGRQENWHTFQQRKKASWKYMRVKESEYSDGSKELADSEWVERRWFNN